MIARTGARQAGAHVPRLVIAFDRLLDWIERSRQRAQLAGLDPDALHDLGLSRADLDAECEKRFWQR